MARRTPKDPREFIPETIPKLESRERPTALAVEHILVPPTMFANTPFVYRPKITSCAWVEVEIDVPCVITINGQTVYDAFYRQRGDIGTFLTGTNFLFRPTRIRFDGRVESVSVGVPITLPALGDYFNDISAMIHIYAGSRGMSAGALRGRDMPFTITNAGVTDAGGTCTVALDPFVHDGASGSGVFWLPAEIELDSLAVVVGPTFIRTLEVGYIAFGVPRWLYVEHFPTPVDWEVVAAVTTALQGGPYGQAMMHCHTPLRLPVYQLHGPFAGSQSIVARVLTTAGLGVAVEFTANVRAVG